MNGGASDAKHRAGIGRRLPRAADRAVRREQQLGVRPICVNSGFHRKKPHVGNTLRNVSRPTRSIRRFCTQKCTTVFNSLWSTCLQLPVISVTGVSAITEHKLIRSGCVASQGFAERPIVTSGCDLRHIEKAQTASMFHRATSGEKCTHECNLIERCIIFRQVA